MPRIAPPPLGSSTAGRAGTPARAATLPDAPASSNAPSRSPPTSGGTYGALRATRRQPKTRPPNPLQAAAEVGVTRDVPADRPARAGASQARRRPHDASQSGAQGKRHSRAFSLVGTRP